MEYMYAGEPEPETYFTNTGSTTVGYDKLINGFRGNSVQIFNPSEDYYITNNSPQNSVVKISENSFVTLDSNLIIPFNDYSDNLTKTASLPVDFQYNLDVTYDTVRYHLRAGYVLQNIDGIILGIEFQDSNLDYVTFSQILLKKGTEQDYVLNPNPITVGASIYDKYFEIKIPSLKSMNDTYLATASNYKSQSLGGLLSASGNGFYYGAPMRISVWQVQSTDTYEGYARYNSARVALLSLEEQDPFGNIGAVIQESDRGQFFEYFATDSDGFIEDFILFQNSIGNSYYINHQIEVLEQIGAAFIETSRFESVQTTAYDTPNFYRPIVRNAAYSVSFVLRYTMSLVNNKDQSRTVRIATYSSDQPAKWGMNITPIQLAKYPQTQKIYNRIYSQAEIKLVGSNSTPMSLQPKEIYKFTNVFINSNYVTASTSNLSINEGEVIDDNGVSQNLALGNGKLTITVSPYDNYYKFKFLKGGPDGDPVAIDLSSSPYYISFIDNAGKKNYIPTISDNNLANPSNGELAFKVDESNSVDILQFTDRRFFITTGSGNSIGATVSGNLIGVASGTSNNTQMLSTLIKTSNIVQSNSAQSISTSVMYWGYWKKQSEADPIDTVNAIREATTLANPQLITINQIGDPSVCADDNMSGTGTNTGSSMSSGSSGTNISLVEGPTSFDTQTEQATSSITVKQTATQTQSGIAPKPIVVVQQIGSGTHTIGEVEPVVIKPAKPIIQTIKPAYVPTEILVNTKGTVTAVQNEV